VKEGLWRRTAYGLPSYAPGEAPIASVSLVSYLSPAHTFTPNPLTLKSGGLYPSLEGRGQVTASLGVEGPRKNKRS